MVKAFDRVRVEQSEGLGLEVVQDQEEVHGMEGGVVDEEVVDEEDDECVVRESESWEDEAIGGSTGVGNGSGDAEANEGLISEELEN